MNPHDMLNPPNLSAVYNLFILVHVMIVTWMHADAQAYSCFMDNMN